MICLIFKDLCNYVIFLGLITLENYSNKKRGTTDGREHYYCV